MTNTRDMLLPPTTACLDGHRPYRVGEWTLEEDCSSALVPFHFPHSAPG